MAEKDDKQKNYDSLAKLLDSMECMTETDSKKEMYDKLAVKFEKLGDFSDAKKKAEECKKRIKSTGKEVVEVNYNTALLMRETANSEESYKKAKEAFEKLGDYKESKKYAEECSKAEKKKERYNATLLYRRLAYVALIIAVLLFLNSKFVKYYWASAMSTVHLYEKSAELFEGLKDYKNSEDKYKAATYKFALKLRDDGKAATARKNLYEIKDYEDSGKLVYEIDKELIEDASVKDTVSVGEFKWIILKKEADKVLLLKAKNMKTMEYDSKSEKVSWKNSTLREYMNKDFLEEAFTKEEADNIVVTSVDKCGNKSYNVKEQEATEDKLYTMAYDEIEAYGDIVKETVEKRAWLRIPGALTCSTAVYVPDNGIDEYGMAASSTDVGVYPIMWLSIK